MVLVRQLLGMGADRLGIRQHPTAVLWMTGFSLLHQIVALVEKLERKGQFRWMLHHISPKSRPSV